VKQSDKRLLVRLVPNAAASTLLTLTLTGCYSAMPPRAAGYYAPALPPAVVVQPAPANPRGGNWSDDFRPSSQHGGGVAPSPGGNNPPSKVDPPPLQPVDPVGMYRVDQSCFGNWAICHFF
jgi:hypothetical protein